MKKNHILIFFLCIASFCYAQNNEQTLKEINTIENSLIKNLLIKGESIKI